MTPESNLMSELPYPRHAPLSRRRLLHMATGASAALLGSQLSRSALAGGASRILLDSRLTLFVDASMSDDSADGLTWMTAKRTVGAAYRLAANGYDLQGFGVTIRLSPGTASDPKVYESFVTTQGCVGQAGFGSVVITGDAASSPNVVIDGGGGDAIQLGAGTAGGPQLTVTSLTIRSPNASGVVAYGNGTGATVSQVAFDGDFAGAHIKCAHGAEIGAQGLILIKGNSVLSHVLAETNGRFVADNHVTLAFENTLGTKWTLAGWCCTNASMYLGGMTFINKERATGLRWMALQSGLVLTGNGPGFLPGTIEGTASSGAQYS